MPKSTGPTATRLERRAIITAGIRLADAEGIGAVTMRRLATEFGVTAMALYRHIGDRETLLRLMAAEAAADFPVLRHGETSWRDALAHMAEADRLAFEAHPWLLGVVLTPERMLRLAGPDDTEALFTLMAAAGFSPETAFDALLGVSAIAIGTAAIRFSGRSAPTEPLEADAHPLTAGFDERGIDADVTTAAMRTTVACLLDGLEGRRDTADDRSRRGAAPHPNDDPNQADHHRERTSS